MKKVRVATAWLDGCAGCHMSLLDGDERLIPLASRIELVYGPLVDAQEFPEAVDVTLVEGAVSSHEDVVLLKRIRERSKLIVALGDCAVTGNVPAMRNAVPVQKLLTRLYGAEIPRDGVPALKRRVAPLQDVVKVDLRVPGCPPSADAILFAIGELLEGRMPDLRGKVCFG